jgi:biotin synthase
VTVTDKESVLAVLRMPFTEFEGTVKEQAREVQRIQNADRVFVAGLIGYDNHCKNRCLYCGMRAGYPGIKRYRLHVAAVEKIIDCVKDLGIGWVFLVSGEDPNYSFSDIVTIVRHAKQAGLSVSLGAGEFSADQYRELESSGLDEYVLKFETSDEALFNYIKPSTTFKKRMECIEIIRNTTMRLASGNIVGLPGQTLDQIADDILLMKDLGISWAPVIPYMPVPNTPLALEGGRGSLETLLKEIALLRIMMPTVKITAQQPGEDASKGLADEQGNLNALHAGANAFFIDMLPQELSDNFHVIDDRILPGLESVKALCALAGTKLVAD